jgi:hypothetical protein
MIMIMRGDVHLSPAPHIRTNPGARCTPVIHWEGSFRDLAVHTTGPLHTRIVHTETRAIGRAHRAVPMGPSYEDRYDSSCKVILTVRLTHDKKILS